MDQDLLLTMFDGFPGALIAADTNRQILKVNKAYIDLFGYTEEESIGNKTSFLYNNIDDFTDAGKYRYNKNKENTETFIVEYKKKNGDAFFGETNSAKLCDSNGEVRGFIGIIRDVSYRKKFDNGILAFQNIVSSDKLTINEKIDSILQLVCEYYGVDIGILSQIEDNKYTVKNCYDKNNNLIKGTAFDLNNTYCEKTYAANDIISTHNAKNSDFATLPCYDAFKLNTYIGKKIYVDGQAYGTLNFSSSDAKKAPFSARDFDIFEVTASWMSYILTKQKYQNALIEEKHTAERESQAKTSFIANMSHEVRTPLNGIMGYADILANMIDDPDIIKLSNKIHTSANSLLDILNDVIDISKIESGQFKVHRSTYTPTQIFEDTVELFTPKAAENGNKIELKISPNMPEAIIGDKTRVKQILSNLVHNAVKFTKNGTIKISAVYDNNKRELRFQVTDTGIGIADDMQERIFEDYIQGDSGISKTYGGTGLGLSITKSLIDLMNGSIRLRSKIGIGTTITVTIPSMIDNTDIINQDALKESRISEDRTYKKEAYQPRILLVEDIAMNAEIAQAMLARAECDVDYAENGQEALEYLTTQKYDLILLDIQMPDIDGITVAREARKLGVKTPIVALTAHILEHEIKEFIAAGMDDYLPKPILYDKLKTTVDMWAK